MEYSAAQILEFERSEEDGVGLAGEVGKEDRSFDEMAVRLDEAPATDILQWAAGEFLPGRLAIVSSFGPGSMVIFDIAHRMSLRLPVIFIDTLHHFPETLELVEHVRSRYGLEVHTFRPAEDIVEFESVYGPCLWERNLELYQQVSKVEPFQRATGGLDAWITGRRKDQSDTRGALSVVEGGAKVRINPLANWSRSDIWKYIMDKKLPYNRLHDRGYASIGDWPLTSPVAPDEHERAGRWKGTGRQECGIHQLPY